MLYRDHNGGLFDGSIITAINNKLKLNIEYIVGYLCKSIHESNHRCFQYRFTINI